MTTISLVIATRNQGPRLSTCLSFINAIDTHLQWELIVTDNGSSDSTPRLLDAFVRSVTFPVTILREPVPGLGRAHNRGWRAAQGEIVAFTDDDCYVSPTLLDEAVNIFADSRIGYCGGRIELYDKTDHPITTNTSTAPRLFPPHSYIAAPAIQPSRAPI